MKFKQLLPAARLNGDDAFYAITEDGGLVFIRAWVSPVDLLASPVTIERSGVHRPAPGDTVEVKYVRGDGTFTWSRCKVLWLGETAFQHEGLHGVEIALFANENISWRWPA